MEENKEKILHDYLQSLSYKSVAKQRVSNPEKFREMARKSAISRRAMVEQKKREKLDKAGEAVDFKLL